MQFCNEVASQCLKWYNGEAKDLELSQAYRRNLREGWAWAAEEFRQRGFRLFAFSDPVQLDRVLEKVIQGAYDEGEKCYKVRLAVVAVQRKLVSLVPCCDPHGRL